LKLPVHWTAVPQKKPLEPPVLVIVAAMSSVALPPVTVLLVKVPISVLAVE